MFYRRRRKSALDQHSSAGDLPSVQAAAHPRSSSVYHGPAGEYEEIRDIGDAPARTSYDAAIDSYELPTLVPSAPVDDKLSNPASSAVAASGPSETTPVYNDTSTTLVDNALYDAERPPVTSTNADDDVSDHTLIENDLYEREDQGPAAVPAKIPVYNDTSTTLVENPVYDASVTSPDADDDVSDHTLIENDLYEREGPGQGPQSSGSGDVYNDTATTLVDNPLYEV